jgi:hypothetical protein
MRKIAMFPLTGSIVLLLSIGAFTQSTDLDTLDNRDTPKESGEQVQAPDNINPAGSRFNVMDNLRISGWGAIEFGQIMQGLYGPEVLDHRWQECFRSRLDATAPVSDRLLINVGTEIWYQYSTTVAQTNGPSYLPGINVIIDRADLTYSPIKGNFPLTIQAGYFPFKYNAEASNLGEYLFRSGCYPTFVTNNFDFPMNRLLGLNIENTLFKDNPLVSFRHNLLLTSETELYPYQDISLSYLPSLNVFKKSFTLGGGVSGSRMFSVADDNTTPHNPKTISEINNIRPVLDSNNVPIPGDTTGDTTFFSFAGIKLMGRFTFDCKPFFHSSLFGPEDLKIYGEVAVLGLRNYLIYKDSSIRFDLLSERMPVMVGFNVPRHLFWGVVPGLVSYFWPAFHNFLDVISPDVFSLEGEYFKNRYFNSYYQEIVGEGVRLPRPYSQDVGSRSGIDSLSYHHNVKWSVYAKKSIGSHVQIVAQVAKDHRHAFINLSDPRYGDFGDNLTTDKDWYYMVKVAYGF